MTTALPAYRSCHLMATDTGNLQLSKDGRQRHHNTCSLATKVFQEWKITDERIKLMAFVINSIVVATELGKDMGWGFTLCDSFIKLKFLVLNDFNERKERFYGSVRTYPFVGRCKIYYWKHELSNFRVCPWQRKHEFPYLAKWNV